MLIRMSKIQYFSCAQVPGELLPWMGLLQVGTPDNRTSQLCSLSCGHLLFRKLAVTNRALGDYPGKLRIIHNQGTWQLEDSS